MVTTLRDTAERVRRYPATYLTDMVRGLLDKDFSPNEILDLVGNEIIQIKGGKIEQEQ